MRRPNGGEIVWEWHVWGYLIKDRDPNQNNDWNHANSISHNPDLDQIAISVLRFSEIWIIDHSTTTQEAAGRNGGKVEKVETSFFAEVSNALPPWFPSSNPMAPRQIEPYGLPRASRVGNNHPGLKKLAK